MYIKAYHHFQIGTLPGTNISFSQGTLEDDFPFLQVGYLSSLMVSHFEISSSQGRRSALSREGLCFRSGEGAQHGVGPQPMLMMAYRWIIGVITPITGVITPKPWSHNSTSKRGERIVGAAFWTLWIELLGYSPREFWNPKPETNHLFPQATPKFWVWKFIVLRCFFLRRKELRY